MDEVEGPPPPLLSLLSPPPIKGIAVGFGFDLGRVKAKKKNLLFTML